jgi:predicted GNAT family acetyltransferase
MNCSHEWPEGTGAKLKVIRHRTGGDLLGRAEPWLMATEAENNLILGVAAAFRDVAETDRGTCYWATIEKDGAILGCAFCTPPHQLSLTVMPSEAVVLLAREVYGVYEQHIPGVAGPVQEASQFARSWQALTGDVGCVQIELRVHKLTEVHMPAEKPEGTLRQSVPEEIDLITDWLAGFVSETGMPGQPRELVQRVQASGKVYVWDDGNPRCMVAAARETPRGACINAVFTPAVNRGRGYASAAVAALSQELLLQGKVFCCLYTDVANPITNSIYRKIGFVPIRDDVHIDFVRPTAG